jgi:peptidyl-tRNA hydrolase, PTH1 family
MRVVAGLGNPGERYARTRHNIGFMVVREIAKRWRVPFETRGVVGSDGAAARATAVVDGEEIELVLPQTYMNRSGSALSGLVESPVGENLVVVYDDVDLPVGALRIRRGGGAGGHRGVESIIETCGPSFVRVRVGVGRPPQGVETADYVLAEISSDQREPLADAAERAADAVVCVLADGVQVAMNRFNGMQATPAPQAS